MSEFAAARNVIARMIADGLREAHDRAEKPKAKDVQARVLIDLLAVVTQPNPFKVGDMVEQIPAFQRYTFPSDGKLAIVSGIGLEPDKESDGSVTRTDMRILLQADATWVEFTVESWRFQKYEGSVA